MRTFLEQADAARETALGIRRHKDNYEGPGLGSVLKRSDRLEAYGAELEYRWLALTGEAEERPSWWRSCLKGWSRGN